MDSTLKRQVTQRVLKGLPIWEQLDLFMVQVQLLERDINLHYERIRNEINRVDNLPRLSNNGELNILPPKAISDQDIVKLYKKGDKGECIIIDRTTLETSSSKQRVPEKNVAQDPTTNSSIKQLEKKIHEGEEVFAMLKEGKPWVRCRVKYLYHKRVQGSSGPRTTFRLRALESNKYVEVGKYAVARIQNHGDKLRVPKRVIAGTDEKHMFPGIIGQEPCMSNGFRYMVLFDDGTAQYFPTNQIYPICYQSEYPWRDFRQIGPNNPYLQAEMSYFFRQFPKRYLLKIAAGEKLELSRNGQLVSAQVLKVDCDTMRIKYKDGGEESIYLGSARLIKRKQFFSQLLKDYLPVEDLYYKLPGNMKRYNDAGVIAIGENYLRFVENFEMKLTVAGNTARKSTGSKSKESKKIRVKYAENPIVDDRTSNPALKDITDERNSHKCGPSCLDIADIKTEKQIVDIVNEFRDVSDLKIPLLHGWKRILVGVPRGSGTKLVYIYQAPCGKIFQQIHAIKRYLINTNSKFDIDYFSLDRWVDLNRSIPEQSVHVYKPNIAVEASTGKILENKFISVMNPINEEELPLDYEYRSETFPHPMLKQRNFSFNHEFKSGCDCSHDCNVRASCVCHHLNEEAHGTNSHFKGIVTTKCQYKDKRLMQQVNTGIFECNEYCSCSSKCPNRVVQNGIRFRLQIRKTPCKGWGVITLDDIPTGAFISTYSAELLDDADKYGDCDMYFADLDYISVVEQQKLNIDDDHKNLDEGVVSDEDASSEESKSQKRPITDVYTSEDEGSVAQSDGEFLPSVQPTVQPSVQPKKDTAKPGRKAKDPKEAREAGFKRIHTLLNESHDYTLDARMQGNVGRFFNHSCDPNSFVQNVFIETHDLRFPVVAFFSKRPIVAMEEITWNYNYKMGSIEGREIRCNCGAPNCAGRIL